MVEGHQVHRVAAAHSRLLLGRRFAPAFAKQALLRRCGADSWHTSSGWKLMARINSTNADITSIICVHFGMSGRWRFIPRPGSCQCPPTKVRPSSPPLSTPAEPRLGRKRSSRKKKLLKKVQMRSRGRESANSTARSPPRHRWTKFDIRGPDLYNRFLAGPLKPNRIEVEKTEEYAVDDVSGVASRGDDEWKTTKLLKAQVSEIPTHDIIKLERQSKCTAVDMTVHLQPSAVGRCKSAGMKWDTGGRADGVDIEKLLTPARLRAQLRTPLPVGKPFLSHFAPEDGQKKNSPKLQRSRSAPNPKTAKDSSYDERHLSDAKSNHPNKQMGLSPTFPTTAGSQHNTGEYTHAKAVRKRSEPLEEPEDDEVDQGPDDLMIASAKEAREENRWV
ncbi:hypothetical protein BJ742DRAFT_742614 [Cladochytrium replicatum]|nr:hypothetical protein BJ742DRAFT_742614 [Cladochytrium replicatum]